MASGSNDYSCGNRYLMVLRQKEKKVNSLFCIYHPLGVKLLTRLRLHISHLNEHKFRHDLVIQHTELKLKLLNISFSVVTFAVLKDYNFLKTLRKLNQIF